MNNLASPNDKDRDANELLMAAQRRFGNLIRSLPMGMAIIRADGSIEAVNGALAKMFGYSEKGFVGKKLNALFHRDLWGPESNIQQWYRDHVNQVVELEALTRDGELVPVDFTLTPLDADAYERFVGFIQDVTPRFQANMLKQGFLQMITHDIRAPLTSLSLFLELMKSDDSCGTLTEFGSVRVDTAKKNVERILNLLSNLLELDRIESEIGSLSLDRVDIEHLVAGSIASVSETAHSKGIYISVEVEQCFVTGDLTKLEQVLVNLLSNAISFSPNTQPIDVKAVASDERVRLSVRDRGAGVPEQEKQIIFQKFKQGTNRKAGNFGLGLAICKEIIRQHSGAIGCSDAPGGGSEFWFELPRLKF